MDWWQYLISVIIIGLIWNPVETHINRLTKRKWLRHVVSFLVFFPLIWILNTLLSLIGHNEG